MEKLRKELADRLTKIGNIIAEEMFMAANIKIYDKNGEMRSKEDIQNEMLEKNVEMTVKSTLNKNTFILLINKKEELKFEVETTYNGNKPLISVRKVE